MCSGGHVDIHIRTTALPHYRNPVSGGANLLLWTSRRKHKTMDVTFVLQESGATATVEVPCDVDAAAAKEAACRALAVSPASVEMRIGTEVVEGTCRLQDTAFDAGVQVVLACRWADMRCPAESNVEHLIADSYVSCSLSCCGRLCVYSTRSGCVCGFDTETFNRSFSFKVGGNVYGAPAISKCRTHCYLACKDFLLKVALPSGEMLRKVDRTSTAVYACGDVVVALIRNGVTVYDNDLTLLRTLTHFACLAVAVSPCGGWVMTSSRKEKNTRMWDVNTGVTVARMPVAGLDMALSRSASLCVIGEKGYAALYDWSGTYIDSIDVQGSVDGLRFTPCEQYLVAKIAYDDYENVFDGCKVSLLQYHVRTMSRVREVRDPTRGTPFWISPCSSVVVFMQEDDVIATRHLYPHSSE